MSEFRLDMGSSKITFPVHSWISSEHKWRVFFGPEAYLPSETPDALKPYRWAAAAGRGECGACRWGMNGNLLPRLSR